MGKKTGVFLILIFIGIGIISATDTEVIIHTVPGHKAMISFLNPVETYSLIESFHYVSNPDGDIKFVFSTTKEEFKVAVWISKDGIQITNKKFDRIFKSGEKLELEVYPSWYVPQQNKNDSLNQSNQESDFLKNNSSESLNWVENSSEESLRYQEKKVTAFSISEGKLSLNIRILYYFFGLFGIAILFFLGYKKVKRIKKPKNSEIKVTKLSELKPISPDVVEQEKKIEEAKKKIEEAERELRIIKNKEKIEEVKKRLIEDEKELIRLRNETQN